MTFLSPKGGGWGQTNNIMSKKKLSDADIEKKLIQAIETTERSMNEAKDENRRTYAANTLAGLLRQYKEMFGESSGKEKKPKMKSVKNF